MKNFKSALIVAAIFALTLSCNLFVCRLSQVSGESMYPTYNDKDVVLVSLRAKTFDRYDVIVFKEPGTNKYLIKRVIGLPGEKVEIIDNYILVNDKLIDDYVHVNMGSSGLAKDGYYLEDGEYFVLGDNRSNSKDSRVIGAVTSDEIVGRVVYQFKK